VCTLNVGPAGGRTAAAARPTSTAGPTARNARRERVVSPRTAIRDPPAAPGQGTEQPGGPTATGGGEAPSGYIARRRDNRRMWWEQQGRQETEGRNSQPSRYRRTDEPSPV